MLALCMHAIRLLTGNGSRLESWYTQACSPCVCPGQLLNVPPLPSSLFRRPRRVTP